MNLQTRGRFPCAGCQAQGGREKWRQGQGTKGIVTSPLVPALLTFALGAAV